MGLSRAIFQIPEKLRPESYSIFSEFPAGNTENISVQLPALTMSLTATPIFAEHAHLNLTVVVETMWSQWSNVKV